MSTAAFLGVFPLLTLTPDPPLTEVAPILQHPNLRTSSHGLSGQVRSRHKCLT
jgi:hypothetical protein